MTIHVEVVEEVGDELVDAVGRLVPSIGVDSRRAVNLR